VSEFDDSATAVKTPPYRTPHGALAVIAFTGRFHRPP
jgi:hypothetical protein